LKSHFVISFIFLTFFLTPTFAAEPAADPKGKTIEEKSLEKGAEENWAVESIYRSQYIYPSNWGQAGIFRVRSAESLPPGTLTFGIGGEFYTLSNGPDFGTGGSAKTIAENLFIGFSPAKRVTLSIMRRSSSTTFGDPAQLISSLGDFNFSGMYSIPLNSSMVLAPIANILVASNFNNLAPAGSTLSAGLGAAFSFSLFPTVGIPLFTHANLIYHMPQIRSNAPLFISQETYFNFSRFDTITFALGAEYKLGDFIPFFNFKTLYKRAADFRLALNPLKLA
jgi:hypothetical protein